MFANMTNALDFQSKALVLRAERQRVIASNIANADTPGYAARDIDFKSALSSAVGDNATSLSLQTPSGSASGGTSHSRHIPLQASTSSLGGAGLGYSVQTQPAMDGNSVDMDQQRANFVDNSVRYEATLRFINGQSKTILSAIQGQ
jgi:flagellar basal-body rod protein FlgB